MNYLETLFPNTLYLITIFLFTPFILHTLWAAPWRGLYKKKQFNIFFGCCVAMLLLWSMKAGLYPGLKFHLLGGTFFMLMFGWRLAVVGITMVLVGATINGSGDWYSFSLNALLLAVMPIMVSYWLLCFAVRRLAHNFFVYTLFNGFFAGAFAMFLTVAVSSLILVGFGPYSSTILMDKYIPIAPFMVFAEAFFTGMMVTSMVLWKPEWVTTFDDRRYLIGK